MDSIKNNKKIDFFDWFLIIGLSIAPMTGYRIWKIGIGEILCFIWGCRFFSRMLDTSNYILDFFTKFFYCMMFGTIAGAILTPNEVRFSDLLTWLFLAVISLLIYAGFQNNNYAYNYRILRALSVFSTIWYMLIYAYSILVSNKLFGIPLWYYGIRFAGGALNPHQVATLFTVNVFILLKDALKNKKIIVDLFLILINLFLLFQTKSSTGLASVFIGFVSFIIIIPVKCVEDEKKNRVVAIEILFLLTIVIIFHQLLIDTFFDFIKSDANGMGRFEIFSYIRDVLNKSPIIGLGPGMHSRENGDIQEFHNTVLEVIAATGVIGLMVFIKLTINIIKDLCYDFSSIPIMVVLYSYGLAGFTMRRLIFWGVLVILIVIAKQKRNETKLG